MAEIGLPSLKGVGAGLPPWMCRPMVWERSPQTMQRPRGALRKGKLKFAGVRRSLPRELRVEEAQVFGIERGSATAFSKSAERSSMLMTVNFLPEVLTVGRDEAGWE